MAIYHPLPALGAELSDIPAVEMVALVAAAYQERNRPEFLRLCQRLARDVVLSFRSARLRPHFDDMYAEGFAAVIHCFDRTTRPLDSTYGYFWRAAWRGMIQWAYKQKILRRKGAKHPDTLLDADISSRDDLGASFIAGAEAPKKRRVDCELESRLFDAAVDVTDLKIMHALQDGLTRAQVAGELRISPRAVNGRIDVIRARIERCVRDRFSACGLRAIGYAYPAIAQDLGTTVDSVRRECGDLTPEELKQQERKREKLAKRAEAWQRCLDNPQLEVFASVA